MTLERKSPVYLRVSDEALREAADIEGFVPYAYDDKDPKSLANKTFITPELADTVQGTLTIGYGHTRTVKPGDRITREEALQLLRKDARDAESCVHRYVNVPLTQGEFDGMWDLFFNVGPGRKRGTNGPDDPGKDGIACLGKTNGQPSTLLRLLNERKEDGSNYLAAAECFTQWRNKGSLWEWGLLKRRIRFMLLFMNLPIVRAMNALPPAMPATSQARYELVQASIARAREELEDKRATAMPLPDPMPEPDPPIAKPEPVELVLDKPLPPPAPPKPAAPVAPSVAVGPAAVKPTPPPVIPPPPVSTKPPPEPVIIAPKSVDVRSIPYGEIDPDKGAKNMTDSQRAIGMVIVGIGSVIQVVTMRLGVGTAVGAIAFDLSRDPVVIALAATGVAVVIGWLTRKRGTKVMTDGMKNATQVLK
jgi:GH24 family phage-related lysozyme (muramidase)